MSGKVVSTLSIKAKKDSMLPIEKLEKLLGEPDSGIEKEKKSVHVALHPKYINNIPLGLVNHFNKLINQWHPQLNGILAGYGRLQLKRPTGNMLNEEAHIHLDVQSEFYLFRPLIGRQLKGVVSKKSPSHVSCLVHGVFNVPCHRPHHLAQNWWGAKAKMKQIVHLTVLKTDMSQRVPFILGDLQNIGLDGVDAQSISMDSTVPSPPVEMLSDSEDEVNGTKTSDLDEEKQNLVSSILNNSSVWKDKKKKKSKKKNEESEAEENVSVSEQQKQDLISSMMNDSTASTSSKKKSKKSKKSKEADEENEDKAAMEQQKQDLIAGLLKDDKKKKKEKKVKEQEPPLEEEPEVTQSPSKKKKKEKKNKAALDEELEKQKESLISALLNSSASKKKKSKKNHDESLNDTLTSDDSSKKSSKKRKNDETLDSETSTPSSKKSKKNVSFETSTPITSTTLQNNNKLDVNKKEKKSKKKDKNMSLTQEALIANMMKSMGK